jgi:hypothetical protein
VSVPGEQVQQAGSVRVPKRFPLASKLGFRATTINLSDPTIRSPVSDAIIINGYAELDPEDNQYWVEKRLGNQTVGMQAGNAGGTGVLPSGFALAIFGPNLYSYIAGVMANLAYGGGLALPLVQGRCAKFIEVSAPGGAPTVFWAVNGSMWNTIPGHVHGSGGYENIADLTAGTGGVPWTAALCDGCVFLDETLYVMDQNGGIWGSDVNVFNTWVATTLIQAGGRQDAPVALAQQMEYLIAFKTTSFRCFYDAGSSAQTLGVGSNLAWVEGADGNYGCANAGSIQLIDQSLLWLTNNDEATPQIARMDGLQVQIVSTPPVERLLQHIKMGAFSSNPNSPANIIYSAGIKRGGHRFYVITVPASTSTSIPFTLAYDLDQQMWYLWTGAGLSYWPVTGVSAHYDTDIPGQTIPGLLCQDVSSGALYYTDIDQTYPTDSGIPAQVDIYTPNWDAGTKRRKFLNAMYFQNDQVSGSKMLVRKSDNDYRSWGPFRQVSLSTDRPNMTRCGTFTKRALNIRHVAPTPFRIKTSDLQMDIGTL